MEKISIINSIISSLASMGVFCQNGMGADIKIQAEFLNASWGTGSKKIEYQASAFLNDAERTLYFWEFTKESGSGLSFGGNSENSFQTGTTLFRKVKSVGYGPDGKAFEYSLDLGAITKTFKETAKQYGWKFKSVLKRDKASYPPGYVPVDYTQQTVYQQVNNQQQFNNPQGVFYAQGNNNFTSGNTSPSKKKNGALFFVPFTALLLITLVFFALSGVSLLGWGLAIAVFIIVFFIRNKVLNFGCLGEIISWLVILVLIFAIYALNITLSGKKQDVYDGNAVQSNVSDQSGEVKKTPVTINDYQLNIFTSYNYIDMNAGKIKPFAMYGIIVNVVSIANPVEYKITNARVTKKPRAGNPVFCTAGLNGSDYEKDSIQNHAFKNGELVLSPDGFAGFVFYVALSDLDFPYTYPEGATIASDKAILDAGVKSDDIRCEVAFDVEVKMDDGKTYYYPLKLELLPGDFLNNPQGEMKTFEGNEKYFKLR